MKIVQVIKTTISNNLGELVKESKWFTQVNHQILTLEDQHEDFQDTLDEIERNYVNKDELYRYAEDSRVDDLEENIQDIDYEQEKLEGRVTDLEDNYQEMKDKIADLTEIIQKMQKQLNNEKENQNG